jgi:hypothetical protein
VFVGGGITDPRDVVRDFGWIGSVELDLLGHPVFVPPAGVVGGVEGDRDMDPAAGDLTA